MNRPALLSLALLAATPADAASLSVRVVDTAGHAVKGAVVTLVPAAGSTRRPSPGRFTVSQQNIQFHPYLTIVPTGSTVSFPNLDPTKHHVYSFSPAKRFELKLFARDESRSVTFDRPGVVALGCNIHDQMSAFVFVTDSPWTRATGGDGTANFTDLPEGSAAIGVWQPQLRAPGNQVDGRIPAGKRSVTITVRLRAAPPAMPPMDY